MPRQDRKTLQLKPSRDINASHRALAALDLAIAGHDWNYIAAQVGYASRGAAFNAVQNELNRHALPKVENYRKLAEMRLDRLLQAVSPLATRKDPDLLAVQRVLQIEERRARLLGLDLQKEEVLANQPYTKTIVLTHRTTVTPELPGSVA